MYVGHFYYIRNLSGNYSGALYLRCIAVKILFCQYTKWYRMGDLSEHSGCFFAMAYIQIDRGHTTVDLLCSKFPQKVQKVIKVVGDVLGTVVCLFSGYCAMRLTADKFSTMTKSSSASNAFVIWPFVLIIAIGFVVVGAAFAWCIVRDILKNDAENAEEKEEVTP